LAKLQKQLSKTEPIVEMLKTKMADPQYETKVALKVKQDNLEKLQANQTKVEELKAAIANYQALKNGNVWD